MSRVIVEIVRSITFPSTLVPRPLLRIGPSAKIKGRKVTVFVTVFVMTVSRLVTRNIGPSVPSPNVL